MDVYVAQMLITVLVSGIRDLVYTIGKKLLYRDSVLGKTIYNEKVEFLFLFFLLLFV